MPEIKSYELEKRLKSKPQTIWEYPAYLLIGEETFLKEELITSICQGLKIKEKDYVVRLDAESIDGRDLIATLETTSFDDLKKMIVIYNADKIDAETCKQMYTFWDQAGFPESNLPIFIADNVDGRKTLWKLVKEEGLWTKFWPLTFADKVLSWIKQRASAIKVKLAPKADLAIFEQCGNDLRKIAKELDKFALVYEQAPVTPDMVKFMIRKSTEVSKYELEDQFAARNIKNVLSLLLEPGNTAEPKDIVMGFLRCTRHAMQAKFHVQHDQDIAFQLTEIGKIICVKSQYEDWNSFLKRNEMIKAGDAIIDTVPMQTKMMWSGDYMFQAGQATDKKDDEPQDKKKRKTKKEKLENYQIEDAQKAAEAAAVEVEKKVERDLAYDVYNHNIWAQRGSIPIAKAFFMANQYSEAELTKILITLSKLYCSVWLGEGDLILNKLECMLAELQIKS